MRDATDVRLRRLRREGTGAGATRGRAARWRAATLVCVLSAALLSQATPSPARELWSDEMGERSVSLDATLKWTTYLSKAEGDTVLFPEEWSAAALWRFRALLDARPTRWLSGQLAYEMRARSVSENAGEAGGAGVLPVRASAPYRLEQLDANLVSVGGTFSLDNELDRAFVSASVGPAEVTVGRQAVGWGRGLVFGAVDIFAPFSPLEFDREWRRGIDAARVTAPLTDLVALEVVGAFGESSDESAYVARLQGYVGDVDGELFFGRRREDDFYAASLSLPVAGAELHAEAAAFVLPDPLPFGASFGSDDTAVQALVGGSRTFDLGAGVYVVAEYHYSGLGVDDIHRAAEYLSDPEVRERYALGDMRTLGRHAVAAQLVYDFSGDAPLSLTWIMSPVDGSGVLMPSVTWSFSDNLTLSASGHLPHGEPSDAGVLRSEYGATPASALIQIGFHY